MKFITLKSGWKTYATCLVGITLGIAQARGIQIPGWVDIILGFFGLGSLRHAVTTQSAAAAADLQTLVRTVIGAVSAPDATPDTVKAALVAHPAVQAAMAAAHPQNADALIAAAKKGEF